MVQRSQAWRNIIFFKGLRLARPCRGGTILPKCHMLICIIPPGGNVFQDARWPKIITAAAGITPRAGGQPPPLATSRRASLSMRASFGARANDITEKECFDAMDLLGAGPVSRLRCCEFGRCRGTRLQQLREVRHAERAGLCVAVLRLRANLCSMCTVCLRQRLGHVPSGESSADGLLVSGRYRRVLPVGSRLLPTPDAVQLSAGPSHAAGPRRDRGTRAC